MRLSGGLVGVVRHDDELIALLDVLGAGEAPVAGLCADLSAVAGDAGEEVVPLLRPDVDADDDERSPDQLRTGDRGGVRVVHAGLLRVGFLPSGEPTAPRYVIDLPRPYLGTISRSRCAPAGPGPPGLGHAGSSRIENGKGAPQCSAASSRCALQAGTRTPAAADRGERYLTPPHPEAKTEPAEREPMGTVS